MRRLAVSLIALAVAVGGALAATAPGAAADDVTLRMERFWDDACRCYKMRFSGTIASGAANEYVAVLRQTCGPGGGTAIAGASTRAGGVWEAEPVSGSAPGQDASTYRALWRGRLSQPLGSGSRVNLPITLTKLGGGRYRVNVLTSATFQDMHRRFVELQRLEDGRWTRVERARLTGAGISFSATFAVRTPGLTLRVFVPAQSAGPCYDAAASETWVSEKPGSLTGPRVVDRRLLCSTGFRGGFRQIWVQANSGVRAGTGSGPSFTVLSADDRLTQGSLGALELHRGRCTRTSASIPLSVRTLRPSAPGRSGREFSCRTPQRVLIRVRAVFRVPFELRAGRPFGWPALTAEGAVKQASLAIRTRAGKPLVFASLHESGRARLFTGRGCLEDTT